MDKMREEFEAWCVSVGWSVQRYGRDESIYRWSSVNRAWKAWQASRAALCVELPDESATFWHQDVCEALDATGVNYK